MTNGLLLVIFSSNKHTPIGLHIHCKAYQKVRTHLQIAEPSGVALGVEAADVDGHLGSVLVACQADPKTVGPFIKCHQMDLSPVLGSHPLVLFLRFGQGVAVVVFGLRVLRRPGQERS